MYFWKNLDYRILSSNDEIIYPNQRINSEIIRGNFQLFKNFIWENIFHYKADYQTILRICLEFHYKSATLVDFTYSKKKKKRMSFACSENSTSLSQCKIGDKFFFIEMTIWENYFTISD